MIEQLLASYVDTFDRTFRVLVNLLYRLLGRSVRRITIGPFGVELRGPSTTSYDQVLKKLEVAHQHLGDATVALDELKTQYTDELQKVETLRTQVSAKKQEYSSALSELDLTKQMLTVDRKKLRATLGVDDTRVKVSAFASGVFASLVAALIWKVGPVIWTWIKTVSR